MFSKDVRKVKKPTEWAKSFVNSIPDVRHVAGTQKELLTTQ